MKWFFLALLAPAIDTVINFIDKYLVEHRVKDSHSLPVYAAIVSLAAGCIFWLIAGTPTLTSTNALLVAGAGAFWLWASALYFHALAKSLTSYIVALLQTIPIFILILSYIFLDETLGAMQLIGFFVVFVAVTGLSIDRAEGKLKLGVAFWQILLANLLWAISAILVELTVGLEDFSTILAYQSFGAALGGLLLYMLAKKVRQAFRETFQRVGRGTLGVVTFNESLAVLSQGITYLAITLGPVALVGVLNGTQVFYALLFGSLLTIFFPRIFNEDVTRDGILIKIGLSVVLFIGVLLIGKS